MSITAVNENGDHFDNTAYKYEKVCQHVVKSTTVHFNFVQRKTGNVNSIDTNRKRKLKCGSDDNHKKRIFQTIKNDKNISEGNMKQDDEGKQSLKKKINGFKARPLSCCDFEDKSNKVRLR